MALLGQVRFEASADISKRGRLRFELWLCFPLNKKLVLNFSGGGGGGEIFASVEFCSAL